MGTSCLPFLFRPHNTKLWRRQPSSVANFFQVKSDSQSYKTASSSTRNRLRKSQIRQLDHQQHHLGRRGSLEAASSLSTSIRNTRVRFCSSAQTSSIMGMFSRFRKTSKTDKRQSKGKQRESYSKPRYMHVPTHAAVDALNGAPSSWKREDSVKIRELNARRTMISMQLDVSVAELLERMPTPPLAGPGHAHQYINTPVSPRWAREPLRLRDRASVSSPLRETYIAEGQSSTGKPPILPPFTTSHH